MYSSYIPALITPFKKDLSIDYQAFEKLISFHLKNSIKSFVVNGTTAESPTTTKEEKIELLKTAHGIIKDSKNIIFGAGSNCTSSTIDFVKEVEELGLADTVLLVAPYYNRPNQEGLFQHFKAIAQSTRLNIMLYNVPSRTASSLDVETVIKLAKIKNIVALKDAVDDFSRVFQFQKEIDKNFSLTSGEDATAFSYFASGGNGCISVSANALPSQCMAVYENYKKGNYNKARELHTNLVNIHKLMFCQPSPAPVKFVLSLLGICSEHVRLPLTSLSKENKAIIKQELEKLEII